MTATFFETLRQSPVHSEIFESTLEGVYRRVLSGWSVAVDGGANHGRHTIPMARIAWSGRVLAFEPIPLIAERLRDALNRAGIAARVTLVEAALAETAGEAIFNYVDEPSADQRFPFMNAALSGLNLPQHVKKMHHQEIEVRTTTVDQEVSAQSGRVDFIKLDLEGGEYHALAGAVHTLRTHRPVVVFEDAGPYCGKIYNYEPRLLPALFRDAGYELFYITGHRFSDRDWLSRINGNWRPFYTLAAPQEMRIGWLLRRVVDDELRKKGMEPIFPNELADADLG